MEEYKIRFINEYKELKEKYEKLHNIIVKAESGTLNFKLNCPLTLLQSQASIMGEYLHILEIRAEIEKVDLNDKMTMGIDTENEEEPTIKIIKIVLDNEKD